MKFSIITPTWNRRTIIPVMINSIFNQTYPDWELLIMDDGSDDGTWEYLRTLDDARIRTFRHDKPRERIISKRELMEKVTGDWIFWCDSDDSIVPTTLEILKYNIEKYPEYKVFNFGQIILSLTGTTIKLANDLPDLGPDQEGMDHFDTGRVGTGGFVFAKECLENIEPLPEIDNPFDFADWFGQKVITWEKEHNLPLGTLTKYNRDDKFCGNPVGDDFVFMWLLTRKYKSKKLPLNLLISLIRTENWLYEFADMSGVLRGPSNRQK